MAENKEKSARHGIQVISRAAAILNVLKTEPRGASLGQIATAVGLPRSTVQRIIGALQEERLVISNSTGRNLRLGPQISALAQAIRNDMVEICRDLLHAIADETGETADLSLMRGANMIFLDQVPGRRHRLRTVSSVGDMFPLTTPANGKACLAQLSQTSAQTLIEAEWKATGKTYTEADMRALLDALDTIKTARLAYDLGEHTAGIAAIGFAFADHAGEQYAISVPIPMTRMNEARPTIEAALLKTAAQLDRTLA